jgi:hypothetical protein
MTFIGMSEGKSEKRPREENDFYPTPEECTRLLLQAEKDFLPQQIWECSCGDGAIGKLLQEAGHEVIGTDLVDRGYGQGGHDFLKISKPRAPSIVTNPPFDIAPAFITQAKRLGVTYMALLLRCTFFHGPDNARPWWAWRPARMHQLGWRPDMYGIGSPDQRCLFTWYIWDERHTDPYTHAYLWPKPAKGMPLFMGVDPASGPDKTVFQVSDGHGGFRLATDAERLTILLNSREVA